jgi:ABC-type transport system involved in multi-copper enzyme maturation permease subunit
VDSFLDFFWYLILIFLFVAYLMILFSIISDIFRSEDVSGVMKGVWIVFLLFFPLITALVYLIARGKGMAERSNRANVETAKLILAAQGQGGPSGKSPAEQIVEAKQLLDAGTISAQEFEALKSKALA